MSKKRTTTTILTHDKHWLKIVALKKKNMDFTQVIFIYVFGFEVNKVNTKQK